MAKFKMHLLVCGGTGCNASRSQEIAANLKSSLKDNGLENEVQVILTGCFGFCEKGPIVKIMPDNTFYTEVKPEDATEIIMEHVVKGRKVTRLLYTDPENKQHVADSKHMGFYKKQMRIALRNCGYIDPQNIEEYIGADGYAALAKCLGEMTPEQVINEIKLSGLRGRGGGGFPTGLKWEIASKNHADQKYVVCNADEGDPGAFMDRSILEGDPHSVLEAMTINGYAIGATIGVIYIRAEYPLAINRLLVAIDQAHEYGLLGKDILGSGFNFDIELRYGAGAFVCGEETALIHSMEGLRGEPTFKPPFPAQSGYNKKPTNVNNVETYANIPIIITKGADWFNKIGTEKSKGTKVFALAGQINNVGLIEVPMGITLREVVYEIGGGIKGGKEFKAVQTGGPSGGCLTTKHLDTPIDYDNLLASGSMMGSGGMVVMDETSCMVAIAKFYLEFTVEESCGKCSPCRIGNKRLHEILEKITKGNGTMEDLDNLRNLGRVIKDASLCGLGQTSPNPVLSTIENFYDEYVEHIKDKKCRAGVCKSLMQYVIDQEQCVGCTACARNCPVNAISGEKKMPHFINTELCIKCGACIEKCKFNAISIC
ncbi:MAG: NADH-ubiquinone oxidoreductase-F iron-sulfur binding region domain-containing protein [Bacteroidales bacterium]|jgi:NADH:ubiquinone oxidoreductase subunit F (NADH-binding)/(2Fe-2S) ferredoxin|nr:NADH-ubiquinone oxidoreductase-F iron-sulfur binding region domain-containing protein [Bacteroidales bacterium]MDD4703779.1 NADH-ubiquinone oxidoreductase-F iron-sulfur binding region domain-containing protein [Bacteroidales bacterium]MDX9797316.1 NADH-ubiquinone oxidoreductase-F iron-sulfur binding region domain-containing protein [Bacteroidales bacterium]